MPPPIQTQGFSKHVSQHVDEYSGVLGAAKSWIVGHFGEIGLIAAGVGLAVIALLAAMKLSKLGFAVLKYMALPGVTLAAVGSLVLPHSFFILLPITIMACSLLLLFKG